MVRSEEIDDSFVARPRHGVDQIRLGDEVVLLDGWTQAVTLNATGALLWERFDGQTSIGEVVDSLSGEYEVSADLIRRDAVAIARQLGEVGFLEGVDPPTNELDLLLVPAQTIEVGARVADFSLLDLDGVRRSLTDFRDRDVLLVNWNPLCRYCAALADRLASLLPALDAADVQLLLVATAGQAANRLLVDAAGLKAPVLMLTEGVEPFGISGTPAAYHIDRTGHLGSEPAYGAVELMDLVRRLADVDADSDDPAGGSIRYLLERDGMCAPWFASGEPADWSATHVYRVDDHHIGVRVDSPRTGEVLDRLLPERVEDPRAGYSYFVALAHATASTGVDGSAGPTTPRALNLLDSGTAMPVRSRDPARVLSALLRDLQARLDTADPQLLRLRTVAAVRDTSAVLLPASFESFAPRLQGLLARSGIALVDVHEPTIDTETHELIVPDILLDHDRTLLDQLARPPRPGSPELAAVPAGRYPIRAWCSIVPDGGMVTRLSPAQAAAANLSSCLDTRDAPTRVRQLGQMLTHVRGYGLWYSSEAELIEGIDAALNGV